MGERADADRLAERLLDEPYADPDDDLRMLSRQLLRRREVIERLEKRLGELLMDGTADLIHANRDIILRITEEGLRRVRKECEYLAGSLEQSDSPPPIVVKDLRDHGRLALRIIEAVHQFHPMHGESWCGWPEFVEE